MERREAVEESLAHVQLMLTVEQARVVLGIGRSLAYGEVRRYLATGGREGIPAVRIGSAIRVPRAGLVELVLALAPVVSGRRAVRRPLRRHAARPTGRASRTAARRLRAMAGCRSPPD
jgi:hypothetical protein